MMDAVIDGLRRMPMLFPGTEVVRFDGVEASVTPDSPDRSLPNAVIYEPGASLRGLLPRLADLYEEAGVRAWTVWVPQDDRRTAEQLAGHGHVLDAAPRAMAARLDGIDLAGADAVDLASAPSLEEIAEVNEAAYDYAPGDFSRIMHGPAPDGWFLYAARDDDGAVVSGVIADHHGDNCDITLVATRPERQGRGLARSLIAAALAEALDRGLETTTLMATKAGFPLYRRLGYEELGGLEMWERRTSPAARPGS